MICYDMIYDNISYDMYLLPLSFNPVAVAASLVPKQDSDNTEGETIKRQ